MSLKRRRLPKPAANATSTIFMRVSWSSCFASSTRRVCATAIGDAPRCLSKRRRSWRSPMPRRSARPSTSPSSSAPSAISASARDTRARRRAPAGEIGRAFGAAAQARPEARLLRGRGARVERRCSRASGSAPGRSAGSRCRSCGPRRRSARRSARRVLGARGNRRRGRGPWVPYCQHRRNPARHYRTRRSMLPQ